MSETTVFYVLDGHRRELQCGWHEKRDAIADLKAQGLLVVGYQVHGTGKALQEAMRAGR